MISSKKLLSFLLLLFATATITAQNCPTPDVTVAEIERADIPGKTMGQKLESLLFWSQEEKERRFEIMQDIYPSILVSPGKQTSFLETSQQIIPQWKDGTTLPSYMQENRVKGVIVLQNNTIKLEKYAEGIDQHSLWTSFSVAKSVSSMLLGVAVKEGDIESMDDVLKKYIPEFDGYDYGEVTVRQLLTMTSGIDWNEDYEDPNSDVGQMYKAPCFDSESHILTYMKPLKIVHEPGVQWNYSTGETDLVGILIQKATGKSLAEYLSEKIWKPYGMQQCAYWLADECSNLNIGGSGLSASLRDYARLGTLMLNQGKIANESVFSKEWLENATSLLYQTSDEGDGYGYLWWRFKNGSYAAVGIFGQMIYVDPNKDLVIAQIAAWPRAGSKSLSEKRHAFIEAVLRQLD